VTALAPSGRSLAEVYRAAAKRVRRGWSRGAYARDEAGKEVLDVVDGAASYCALGALYVEGINDGSGAPTSPEEKTVARPLLAALARAGKVDVFDESANPIGPDAIAAGDVDPDPVKVISPWNDAKGRTKRDVAAWLDRVAGELEKGGAT
jgi:hypothetical protein